MFLPSPGRGSAQERQADVAQLVAHHLAKVRVAGSNPVVRSEKAFTGYVRGWLGGVAERRGNGLQSRVHGFKSRLHLARGFRGAIGAAGARFLDTEEVTGSIPVSRTTNTQKARDSSRAFCVGQSMSESAVAVSTDSDILSTNGSS